MDWKRLEIRDFLAYMLVHSIDKPKPEPLEYPESPKKYKTKWTPPSDVQINGKTHKRGGGGRRRRKKNRRKRRKSRTPVNAQTTTAAQANDNDNQNNDENENKKDEL
eukprot:TRINITY_DN85761_c0_g1_i1.p4 TRINITY_DN85761_c0_g1~~TRINITY_DN85761_c0_g1_i1.p4  ORF type:complete len:107 (+),score=60.57 TRINITY_DN85761_c0_g1_i1:417-737(+)